MLTLADLNSRFAAERAESQLALHLGLKNGDLEAIRASLRRLMLARDDFSVENMVNQMYRNCAIRCFSIRVKGQREFKVRMPDKWRDDRDA